MAASNAEGSTPARLYCLLVGAALVVAGMAGFFYESSFATGDEVVSDQAFGVLAVNGWHNVVHMAIGALLLIAAGGADRAAAMTIGFLYLALSIWGFAEDGGALLDVVPVDDEDNILHMVLGLTGLLAAFASGRGEPRTREASRAPG